MKNELQYKSVWCVLREWVLSVINENYVVLMMNFITYCVTISTDTEIFNTNAIRKCININIIFNKQINTIEINTEPYCVLNGLTRNKN